MGKSTQHFEKEFGMMGIGKENAILSKDLARIKKISERRLRRIVHEFRVAGYPICSSTSDKKGYFLPKNAAEIDGFIAETRSRIKELEDSIFNLL